MRELFLQDRIKELEAKMKLQHQENLHLKQDNQRLKSIIEVMQDVGRTHGTRL